MNNSFYKDMMLSMPLGYGLHKIILDDDGNPCDYEFIEINSKFEEATGLLAAEIIGKRVTEVLPGITEGDFDWIAAYGNVALNGTVLQFEQYAQPLCQWYHINAYSPDTGFFITLFDDITKEKEEYLAAAKGEEKLKKYLESAPLGIVVSSKCGSLKEVSSETSRILGYSEEELFTIDINSIIAAGSRSVSMTLHDELVSNGQAECQLQIKPKKGRLRWLSVTARTLSSDSYIFYCRDITPYRSLEASLDESELLYRTFIDASSDLIYLKDDRLRYRIVNDAFINHTGRPSSEIIGRRDEDFQTEQFAKLAESSDRETLQNNSSTLSELEIDGVVFQAVKFPVPFGNNRKGVGAFIHDITEERRQEKIHERSMQRHRILANALLMNFETNGEQMGYALEEFLKLTGSQYGYIFEYNDDNRELIFKCWTAGAVNDCAIPDLQKTHALDESGLWGEAVRSRRPVIINDYESESAPKTNCPVGHIKLRNFMAIPVILNDKIVATVGLANKDTDYDDVDVDELVMLMTGIWTAVEKKVVQKKMEDLLIQTQAMFSEHDAPMLLIQPKAGQIIDANPAAVAFYGYTLEELLNLKMEDISTLINDDEKARHRRVYDKKERAFSCPHRLKSGKIRIVDIYSCPITYKNEEILFSIIFDVTEREEAFDEIKYLSFHDHLTGLYNRRYFDNVLKLMNDERFLPLTIVIADVNGLKLINDSFGHAEGDNLLLKAAQIISDGCRKNDVSARIGGDEFAIILPNTNRNSADIVVQRIKNLQSNIWVKNLNLSMAFGYAVKEDVISDIGLVVSEAENKMYRNKMLESTNAKSRTIDVILKSLNEKCNGELDHANRVSQIAQAIAAEMNLGTDSVSRIGVAGLLHDIGKIGVDDDVLTKSGIYTPSDRLEIEKHSASGWRILNSSDEYANLADCILSHHENIDGKGYPSGLSGDSIPLEARIIAVSDAYDAMTRDRPYRKAIGKQAAIDELRKFSGTQFDSTVVSTFIDKLLLGENGDEF